MIKRIYFVLAIAAIIVLGLNTFGSLEGELRWVGFGIFTILCGVILFENRKSKWKIVAIVSFYCILSIPQMFV